MNENEVLKRFLHLEGLLRHYHQQRFREFGPLGNPLRGQGRVISILKLKNEISQKDLGYLLDMRNQSLMELLSRLEKSGYITRTPSEEDRRTMVVALTPSGAAAAEQTEDHHEGLAGIFACLSAEEQENFSGCLDRIIAELEKKFGGDGADIGWDEGLSDPRSEFGPRERLGRGGHNRRDGAGQGRGLGHGGGRGPLHDGRGPMHGEHHASAPHGGDAE
jgi:DNA-binding MarR family transcriptional regulator